MGGLDSRLKEIKKALEGKKVRAGWFESAEYTKTGKSVASVAATHEYGTQKIPPRPFMRPTIASKKSYWGAVLSSEVRRGNKKPLEVVALVVEGDIRDTIIAVNEPPLKRSTIKARERRGNSNTSPLTDTGRMLATLVGVVSEDS